MRIKLFFQDSQSHRDLYLFENIQRGLNNLETNEIMDSLYFHMNHEIARQETPEHEIKNDRRGIE